MAKEGSAEATIRDIKRKTRRKYNAEEKIRIVIEGLRGEVWHVIWTVDGKRVISGSKDGSIRIWNAP